MRRDYVENVLLLVDTQWVLTQRAVQLCNDDFTASEFTASSKTAFSWTGRLSQN
jgi:hypothetical protein